MGRVLAAGLIVLLALVPGGAVAHKLKVFATAVGARIDGTVYFVGGGPASGARVTIEAADGTPLASMRTGRDGAFTYIAKGRRDQVIVADSGDGHQARITIPGAPLAAKEPVTLGTTAAQAAPADPDLHGSSAPPPDALTALVEEAVARQIGPLRAQLNAFEDTVRWRDVLGGIGYIVGLAGLAAWLATHRHRRGER